MDTQVPVRSATRASRMLRFLAGASLTIIGLLTGILVMMLSEGGAPDEPRTEFRLVERVGLPDTLPEEEFSEGLASALQLSQAFRSVANRAVPMVVSIETESRWRLRRPTEDDPSGDGSSGSGVVITPHGHIVTNYHLLEHAAEVRVTFADRSEHDAHIVGMDPSTDLAVIRIAPLPEGELMPITFGDSDAVLPGDWVLAIGNPLNLASTVTAGIVSALGRSVEIISSQLRVENFIQTDAAINPGNSGGALVNLHGELIGINTAIATSSGFYEGYGLAIPANLVLRIVHDLIDFGKVRRGYMGVSLTNVDTRLARTLGLGTVHGAFVERVHVGSAAEKSGIQVQDVILRLNDQAVTQTNQLQSAVALYHPGDEVALTLWRDGQQKKVMVTLLGQEDPAVSAWLSSIGIRSGGIPEMARYFPRWGLVLRNMQDRDQEYFAGRRGVIIEKVADTGVPEEISTSHLIERMNNSRVRTVEQAGEILAEARYGVLLLVVDEELQSREVWLEIPE
ncbi:MAG: trypsin-like peptidase domain-containing protein [Bacteroidota bacterium]|nr:trypsin-like peptidase domain-containing protein [Bacteroidota bacterium]